MLPSASPWFHVPWVGEAGGGLIRSCSRCFDGASHRRGKGRAGKAILDKMKSIKPEANFDTARGAVAMTFLAQDTLQTLITISGYTLVALTVKSCNFGAGGKMGAQIGVEANNRERQGTPFKPKMSATHRRHVDSKL